MKRTSIPFFAVLSLLSLVLTSGMTCAQTQPVAWEADVAKLEAAQKAHPAAPGGVVFVGSSTIRIWNLDESFPNLKAVNHGFGGSMMSDAADYESRLVSALKPRLVVLYSGDNDIQSGVSPQAVFASFAKFADALHAEAPDAKLIVLAIKPSPSRWAKYPLMQQANQLIAGYTTTHPFARLVDLGPLLLDDHGQPRPELFRADGLHMSDAGYVLWSNALRPVLSD